MNKINYQKELDKITAEIERTGEPKNTSPPQLLCTLQQLCIEISVKLF